MSATTFLSNESLWDALSAKVKASGRVDAAVAYFGQGGAKLLPLRRGDRIIVDMSLSTVRAGATDPREIAKLVRRGVQAFTRRNLHAKILVTEDSLIAGSANISRNSQNVLDEAAILTTERSAIRRAREFIDRLCTEPIRPEYLKMCKRFYKPPQYNGQQECRGPAQMRATHSKLWIVNLHDYSLPERETKRYERGEEKARRLIKDTVGSTTGYCHWPRKPHMADKLEQGDWLIQVVRSKNKIICVHPPAMFLELQHYTRDRKSGKQRYIFHLEEPLNGETMAWPGFRRRARSHINLTSASTPRTMPVRDVQAADRLLSFWTQRGKISKG